MHPSPTVNSKTYAPCAPVRVAFLGLGVMGGPMAGHLAKAGHQVTVYNRTPAKSQAWLDEFAATPSPLGAHAHAATPAAAAAQADIVFLLRG